MLLTPQLSPHLLLKMTEESQVPPQKEIAILAGC